VTAQPARRRLVLTDDGIIDPIAVELAARGTRPVALTRTERQRAAAAILAGGGSPYVIATRLHVSGTTALKLAAQCDGAPADTTRGRARYLGPLHLRTGTWSGIATGICGGTTTRTRAVPAPTGPPANTGPEVITMATSVVVVQPSRCHIARAAGGQR
jgi:hypothetical protein